MKVVVKETKLSPEKIMEQVKAFFGNTFRLNIVEEIPNCCVAFANDLGFVNAQVVDKGNCRELILTTREWEYQVQEFLGELK